MIYVFKIFHTLFLGCHVYQNFDLFNASYKTTNEHHERPKMIIIIIMQMPN
jgi:hypothetical protein